MPSLHRSPVVAPPDQMYTNELETTRGAPNHITQCVSPSSPLWASLLMHCRFLTRLPCLRLHAATAYGAGLYQAALCG